MPNRLIKESICASDTINGLSWYQEVFFYRLITVCDDYGRMDARPQILKGRMFPLKEDLRSGEVQKALNALDAAGLIRLYQVRRKPFLQVLTWDQHQQIRAKVPKYPGMDEADGDMIADDIRRYQMISDDIICPRNPIQSESNPNPNPEGRVRVTRFAPPSLAEVSEYCRERGNRISPEAFIDFYASKGWKVGNTPMKDWKAAVRTWEQRDRAPTPAGKTVSAQRYSQREYDEKQLEETLGVNDLFKAEG